MYVLHNYTRCHQIKSPGPPVLEDPPTDPSYWHNEESQKYTRKTPLLEPISCYLVLFLMSWFKNNVIDLVSPLLPCAIYMMLVSGTEAKHSRNVTYGWRCAAMAGIWDNWHRNCGVPIDCHGSRGSKIVLCGCLMYSSIRPYQIACQWNTAKQ